MTDPIVQENIEFLQSRSQAGIEKYGTTLARTDLNLIEWLQHAREEAADLLNYLTRVQRELVWRTDKPPLGQRCILSVRREDGQYEDSGYFNHTEEGFDMEDGGWVNLEDMIAWMPFPRFDAKTAEIAPTVELLTDEGSPFDKIEDADHHAEVYYPENVKILTKDGVKLCKTCCSNARQPDLAYSYYFVEISK